MSQIPVTPVAPILDISGLILDISGPVLDTSGPHSGLQVRLYFPLEQCQKVDVNRVLFLTYGDLQTACGATSSCSVQSPLMQHEHVVLSSPKRLQLLGQNFRFLYSVAR